MMNVSIQEFELAEGYSNSSDEMFEGQAVFVIETLENVVASSMSFTFDADSEYLSYNILDLSEHEDLADVDVGALESAVVDALSSRIEAELA